MTSIRIARCPEHGLHGERTECFVCGGPVEQVEVVPVPDEAAIERAALHLFALGFVPRSNAETVRPLWLRIEEEQRELWRAEAEAVLRAAHGDGILAASEGS